jgi:hypothetical protein
VKKDLVKAQAQLSVLLALPVFALAEQQVQNRPEQSTLNDHDGNRFILETRYACQPIA